MKKIYYIQYFYVKTCSFALRWFNYLDYRPKIFASFAILLK